MKEKYKTVEKEATAEIVEKRSRFIATVKPVDTEEEAVEFLEHIKKEYWDARHHVYAYILEKNNIQRYSDDGEPAGTAGVPILDYIKKEGLSNLIVVVTRYFGGILLGTGGLVHAYSKAAKSGVIESNPIEMLLCQKLDIFCDYNLLGKIQNETYRPLVQQGDIEYTDKVKFTVFSALSETERLIADLIDKTNGRISIEKGEIGYKKYMS